MGYFVIFLFITLVLLMNYGKRIGADGWVNEKIENTPKNIQALFIAIGVLGIIEIICIIVYSLQIILS